MKKNCCLFLLVLPWYLACSKNIQTGRLTKVPQAETVRPLPAHKVMASADVTLDDESLRLYQKIGKPSFALIRGYYQLPEVSPFGAVIYKERTTEMGQVETLTFISKERPFALVPVSGKQALGLDKAINSLMDQGIRLLEISMADAQAVLQAEKRALQSKKPIVLQQVLPSSAQMLITISEDKTKEGPIFMGRVVRTKDGRLLAYKVMRTEDGQTLGVLVTSLVKDAIRRLQS